MAFENVDFSDYDSIDAAITASGLSHDEQAPAMADAFDAWSESTGFGSDSTGAPTGSGDDDDGGSFVGPTAAGVPRTVQGAAEPIRSATIQRESRLIDVIIQDIRAGTIQNQQQVVERLTRDLRAIDPGTTGQTIGVVLGQVVSRMQAQGVRFGDVGQQGAGQQGGQMNQDQILRAYSNGSSRDDTLELLKPFMDADAARRLLDDIDRGKIAEYSAPRPTPVQLGSGDTGPAVTNFLSMLRGQQAFPDVARRFALESGLAPSMRGFAESLVGRQGLPFAVSETMKGGFPQLDDPQNFLNFLRSGTNAFSVDMGSTLRSAANFLRTPNMEGLLGPGQETLNEILLGPEGSVGSERFAPIVGALTQDAGRRFLPGLGNAARTGVSRAINNMLALNPTRFEDPTGLIDWLATQGLLGSQ